MSYPHDDAPSPNTDIVGFVKYHLPNAIRWAEAEANRVARSRNYWSRTYKKRDLCPVGHRPSDNHPGCGYCENARLFGEEPNIVRSEN